jgi:hypothetical protein
MTDGNPVSPETKESAGSHDVLSNASWGRCSCGDHPEPDADVDEGVEE